MKIIRNEGERRVDVTITIPQYKKFAGMQRASAKGFKSFSQYLESLMDKDVKENP